MPELLTCLARCCRARQDQDISELFQVLNITDAAQINKLFQTGA